MIIAIEGIDGSGKSTIVKRIAAERGYASFSEPYNRSILESVTGDVQDIQLFFDDRKAAMQKGTFDRYWGHPYNHLLLDRSVVSSMAYQASREMSWNQIYAKHLACGFMFPNAVILLKISPELALSRISNRQDFNLNSVYENCERLRVAAKRYDEICKSGLMSFAVINAAMVPSEVIRQTFSAIDSFIIAHEETYKKTTPPGYSIEQTGGDWTDNDN